MKNFSVLDLTLLAALGFGSVLCTSITTAIAAEETPVPMPAVERMRDKAEERTEARVERRKTLESHVQDRVVNLSNNVTANLNSVLVRIDLIAARLETRIEKLDALGADTTAAQKKLTEAQEMIDAAQVKLASLPSTSDAIRGDSPRESFALVRAQFVEIRDMVRQSHSLLIDTVATLKEAVRAREIGNGVSDAVSAE